MLTFVIHNSSPKMNHQLKKEGKFSNRINESTLAGFSTIMVGIPH